MKNEVIAKQQNKIYEYAFLLSIVISIVSILILYYFSMNTENIVSIQLQSIANGLVSATIFAVLFSYLANKELVKLLKLEIENMGDNISIKLLSNIKTQNKYHIPNFSYSPTKDIDSKFNKDLSLDIRQSTFYLFKGVSAKYVPIRIRHTLNHLSQVKVIILNPNNSFSINMRAKDRYLNPKYSKKTIEELMNEIKLEIYSCVIALFDARYHCPIEIAYDNGTSVTRLEIFDTALYLALYHTTDASTQSFPETFRYKKESIQYNLHRLDSFREFDVSSRKVKFDNTTTQKELEEHLKGMGMSNVNPETINKIREKNDKFSKKFVKDSLIDIM